MPAHQQSPRSLSKRYCTSGCYNTCSKGAYRGDPSQQSERIADVGQHKYGQRQNRSQHHLHSDRKSTLSTNGTGAYQRLLAVVMTKVQLLHIPLEARRPSGLSSVNLLVYWQPPIKTQSRLEQHCYSAPLFHCNLDIFTSWMQIRRIHPHAYLPDKNAVAS
jgi:hypothetical protein